MEAGVRDPWNPGEAFEPECPSSVKNERCVQGGPACPVASGLVPPDSMALDRLGWGTHIAMSRPEQSLFWDVATASESLQSVERLDPASVGHVRRFLKDISQSHDVVPADEPAWEDTPEPLRWPGMEGVMFEEEEREPPDPAQPGSDDPVREGDDAEAIQQRRFIDIEEEDDLSTASLRCCVREGSFEYPLSDESYQGKVKGKDDEYMIMVETVMSVEFIDYEEKKGCDCNCCLFKQYVETKFDATRPSGEPLNITTGGAFMEDCVIKVPNEEGGTNNLPLPAAWSWLQELMEKEDLDLWTLLKQMGATLECFKEGGSRGGDREDATYTGKGKCIVKKTDQPHVRFKIGTPVKYHSHFIGKVLDLCNNKALVAQREFTIDWDYPQQQEATVKKK